MLLVGVGLVAATLAVALIGRLGPIHAVAVLFVAEAWRLQLPGVVLSGINVTPIDAAFIAALIRLTFIARSDDLNDPVRNTVASRFLVMWSSFSAYLLVELVRGAAITSVGRSINEARSYIYFCVGLVYVMLIFLRPKDYCRLRLIGLVCVWSLVARTVLRTLTQGLISNTSQVQIDGTEVDARPLYAWHALILAQLLILLLASSWVGMTRAHRTTVLIVGFGCVLVLEQRTVWVATVMGLIVCALGSNVNTRVRRVRQTTPYVVVAVYLLALIGGLGTLGTKTAHSIATAFAQNGTFIFRVDTWKTLVSSQIGDSATRWLFGAPFGTGYFRFAGYYYTDIGPHSLYVQTLLRFGLVGLCGVIISLLFVILKSWRQFRLVSAIFSMQLVYFVSYGIDFEQGVFLGLLVAIATAKQFGNRRTSRADSGSAYVSA